MLIGLNINFENISNQIIKDLTHFKFILSFIYNVKYLRHFILTTVLHCLSFVRKCMDYAISISCF